MTTQRLWTRWAALLALTAILAACGPAVTLEPATTPEPASTPEPAERQASCDDSAIRLLDHDAAGVHGAIFADTLHMGGATAPATCTEPTNESLLAGLSLAEDLTAQVQQSRYYLIVIRYPGGNRLYIVTRRGDGTGCVVDLNDKCIAQVTDLPDDFDLEELPDDVAPTIPAGRPVSPPTAPSEPTAPSDPPTPSDPEPPPAPAPPPAGERPPVGSRQAPAWPAEAADLKIEAVLTLDPSDDAPPSLTLPEPTGNPTPEVSVKGLMPLALVYIQGYCPTVVPDDVDPDTLPPSGCFNDELPVRILAPTNSFAAKGTITLVASNSEGSAELDIPYNLTCNTTLAESVDRLRGSWVPIHHYYDHPREGKYTALTIGDTITTVPASTGSIDRDWGAELARRGETPPVGYHANGHTMCGFGYKIFHPEWVLARPMATWWNYSTNPFYQTGCERMIDIIPRDGDTTLFVPAGCNDPPYGDPP